MARVVGEDGDIASDEVDGARVAAADEDGCLCRTLVEVEPLLSLWGVSEIQQQGMIFGFGCFL